MDKIKVEFEAEQDKIDALIVYLGRKNSTLEIELERHTESLYNHTVPAVVRDYIDSNIERKTKKKEV